MTKIAKGYGRPVDEELLQAYQDAAGHRTDTDIDKAYKEILSNGTSRRMPTPSEFREACGILRVYRDGTRPQ